MGTWTRRNHGGLRSRVRVAAATRRSPGVSGPHVPGRRTSPAPGRRTQRHLRRGGLRAPRVVALRETMCSERRRSWRGSGPTTRRRARPPLLNTWARGQHRRASGLLPRDQSVPHPWHLLGSTRSGSCSTVGRLRPDRRRPGRRHPLLLVGAVDVSPALPRVPQPAGPHHRRLRARLSGGPHAVPAVRADDGTYWDGLFSQNPPVHDLLEGSHPDELWVIQVNPLPRATEPTTLLDIADRRNELSGNLSLYQELAFIEKIDQLLDDGLLATGGKYKQVVVRVLELPARSSRAVGPASKLNRDPAFLRDLIPHGRRQADVFLTALAFEQQWRTRDVAAVRRFLADDVELTLGHPLPRARAGPRLRSPRVRGAPLPGDPDGPDAQAARPGAGDLDGAGRGC